MHCRKKSQIWEEIEKVYNVGSEGIYQLRESLKSRYENYKKRFKEKYAADKNILPAPLNAVDIQRLTDIVHSHGNDK